MPRPHQPGSAPLVRPGSANSALDEILRVLNRILEEAQSVEVEVGVMPGADEALTEAKRSDRPACISWMVGRMVSSDIQN